MSGITFWITGLSGAGKTTVGKALYDKLKKDHENVVFLDGDVLRDVFKTGIDAEGDMYSKDGRRVRAFQYARLSKMLSDQDIYVVCCTISMFDEVRDWNRNENKCYFEVFLDVPMDVLRERDQKGLYSRFDNGNQKNLVGFDIDPELPKNPDVVIVNDGSMSVEECVNMIISDKRIIEQIGIGN